MPVKATYDYIVGRVFMHKHSIEDIDGGDGSGFVTGTGSPNYLARWQTSS